VAKTLPRPSDGELDIMRVLWSHDGSTAREIYKHISQKHKCERTTVTRQLQALLDKGLIRRDEELFPQRYHATAPEPEVTGRLLRDFVQTVFGGSARRLLMHLLADDNPSAAEMRAIRKRLKQQTRPRSKRPQATER